MNKLPNISESASKSQNVQALVQALKSIVEVAAVPSHMLSHPEGPPSQVGRSGEGGAVTVHKYGERTPKPHPQRHMTRFKDDAHPQAQHKGPKQRLIERRGVILFNLQPAAAAQRQVQSLHETWCICWDPCLLCKLQ